VTYPDLSSLLLFSFFLKIRNRDVKVRNQLCRGFIAADAFGQSRSFCSVRFVVSLPGTCADREN
jgi:hypothetical protein